VIIVESTRKGIRLLTENNYLEVGFKSVKDFLRSCGFAQENVKMMLVSDL
jgi:hypothetical protein